jgi:hypothetical protein
MKITSSAAAALYEETGGHLMVTGEEVSERGRMAGCGVDSHFLLIWIGP